MVEDPSTTPATPEAGDLVSRAAAIEICQMWFREAQIRITNQPETHEKVAARHQQDVAYVIEKGLRALPAAAQGREGAVPVAQEPVAKREVIRHETPCGCDPFKGSRLNCQTGIVTCFSCGKRIARLEVVENAAHPGTPAPVEAGVDDFARLCRIKGVGQVLITIEDPEDDDDCDEEEVKVQFRIPDVRGIAARLSITAASEDFARSGMRSMTEDQIREIIQPMIDALGQVADAPAGREVKG